MSIADDVAAGFAPLHEQAEAHQAIIAQTTAAMEHLSDEEVAFVLAGLIKATADKKSAATAMMIAKSVLGTVLKLLP